MIGHFAGYVITSLGVGVARPFFVRPILGVKVYFCRTQPLSGLTFACHPQILPSRRRVIPFLAGGIVFNGGLALASLALAWWTTWGRSIWLALLLSNATLAAMALLPFRFHAGKAIFWTDGALILKALRGETYSPPSAVYVEFVEFIQRLASAIGDTVIA